MKTLFRAAFAAALVLSTAPLAIAPATAQAIKGIGIVNLQAVVGNSNAFRTAEQQRPVTYKSQIDQAEARRQQIANQLTPMVQKFETDRAAASPNQQSLQQQATTIQRIEQEGQREIQQMLQPVTLSRAYVEEQISDKLDEAITNAAKTRKVSLILTPDNVLHADNEYNMNQAVLDELNKLLPSAQLVPPSGWLPRAMREEQAAAQAAQQPAQPATGAVAPSGR